jgi:hypothetical protein
MMTCLRHLSLAGLAAVAVLAASSTAHAQHQVPRIPPLPKATPQVFPSNSAHAQRRQPVIPPLPPANLTYPPSPTVTPLDSVTPNSRPDRGQYRLGVQILVNQTGARVLETFPGGAGEDMGLEPGDVIVQINGRRVTSLPLYHRLMDNCGGDAQVTVWKASVQQYERWQVSWNDDTLGGVGGGGPSVKRQRGR